MKKGLIIAAIVLVIIGATLFVCAFAASGYDLSAFGVEKTETNTYVIEETFDKIEVDTKSSDVTLRVSEDGKCNVVCEEKEEVKHLVSVQDGTLKIIAEDTRKWSDRFSLFSSGKDLSVSVYLPASAYASLKVSASTGDILVPRAFTFETIEIKGSTCDVYCYASATGRNEIKVSTGDIMIEGASAGEAVLTASTGDISVESFACEGDLSVSFGTGKAALTAVDCKNLISEGSTGDFTLTDVIASEKIKIKTGTGDVLFDKSDAAELEVETSTGDVTGTLRSAKVFSTDTSTGSVRVPNGTSGGNCTIKTRTGDIRIEISEG
ncbi:MAG: DUF4097 family beta strand repeat protein [Clostridia bacterium]|nr:DUF4097 family beta strand repeat protein [Clostridia bacterium]